MAVPAAVPLAFTWKINIVGEERLRRVRERERSKRGRRRAHEREEGGSERQGEKKRRRYWACVLSTESPLHGFTLPYPVCVDTKNVVDESDVVNPVVVGIHSNC